MSSRSRDNEQTLQARLDALNELYARLQRNDPTCTKVNVDRLLSRVDGDGSWFPRGYGPQLGQALLGNTSVTAITLTLEDVLEKNNLGGLIPESADSILQFLRQSPSLQRVVMIATDGGSRWDDRQDWYENCEKDVRKVVQMVFMAVAQNPHQKNILLDLMSGCGEAVDVSPDTLVRALRTTTSIQDLSIVLGDGGTPGWCNIPLDCDWANAAWDERSRERGQPSDWAAARARMVQAFGDNCSLKRLCLSSRSDRDTLDALWPALRRNGSLESVKYCDSGGPKPKVSIYTMRNRGIAALLQQLNADTSSSSNSSSTATNIISSNTSNSADLVNSDDDDDDDDDTSYGTSFGSDYSWYKENNYCHTTSPIHLPEQRPLLVMPTVFVVVQQTPRMAATRTLQGLLGMSRANAIGKRSSDDGKLNAASDDDTRRRIDANAHVEGPCFSTTSTTIDTTAHANSAAQNAISDTMATTSGSSNAAPASGKAADCGIDSDQMVLHQKIHIGDHREGREDESHPNTDVVPLQHAYDDTDTNEQPLPKPVPADPSVVPLPRRNKRRRTGP